MGAYKLYLLGGITEYRWTGCAKRLACTGETLVYSCRINEKHKGGVGIMMNRRIATAITVYEMTTRAHFQQGRENLSSYNALISQMK